MTYGSLPAGGYPGSSKWLHWLVALCVIIAVPVGIALPRLDPGPTADSLYNLHKSLGALIFLLMVLRIVNRFTVGAPAPEPGLAAWKRVASSAVHGLLYVLLIVQPIVGYLANSAFGASTPFFGIFTIPPAVAQNEALSNNLFALHRLIGITLALLVLIHVGAALQHYFIEKDGVLQRMLPQAFGGK
ncbi:MAG: cytochrome b [Bradyrhizobiaceae bacterium]|nr:cytochrome b [Bradyrhizobiaceae bacterium]